MRSPSFFVYYGHDPRLLNRLQEADLVILETRGWTPEQLASLQAKNVKVLAYISPFAWPDWMGPVKWWWGSKERDPAWNAWWLSLSSMGWRRQVNRMWRQLQGPVDGLFFDNLDRLEQDPHSLKPFLRLLQNLRREWPQATLVGNRGFAHWPKLRPHLDGVLFENLTDKAFSAQDRRWVEEQLLHLQGTQVYALDYHTRRVETQAREIQGRFPQMAYYCAPNESLQSVSEE